MRLRLRLLVVLGGLLGPLVVPGAAVADGVESSDVVGEMATR